MPYFVSRSPSKPFWADKRAAPCRGVDHPTVVASFSGFQPGGVESYRSLFDFREFSGGIGCCGGKCQLVSLRRERERKRTGEKGARKKKERGEREKDRCCRIDEINYRNSC